MTATAEAPEREIHTATAPPPIPRQLVRFSGDTSKPLFGDSLLELHQVKKQRRIWTTITSLVLQSCLLGVLILIPLWFTDALPTQQLVTFLVAPAPPPPPPVSQAVARVVKRIQSNLMSSGQLRAPTRVPAKVAMIRGEGVPPPMPLGGGGVAGGVPGGIPGGQLDGVIGGIISSTPNTAVVPKLALPTPPKRVRISQGVTSGLLIRKIEPSYPVIARSARIQGQVILKAIIDKEGNIRNLQMVSGHVLLAPAAIDAVKRWVYKPFLLNGEPVEVETTVTVTFQLQSS